MYVFTAYSSIQNQSFCHIFSDEQLVTVSLRYMTLAAVRINNVCVAVLAQVKFLTVRKHYEHESCPSQSFTQKLL